MGKTRTTLTFAETFIKFGRQKARKAGCDWVGNGQRNEGPHSRQAHQLHGEIPQLGTLLVVADLLRDTAVAGGQGIATKQGVHLGDRLAHAGILHLWEVHVTADLPPARCTQLQLTGSPARRRWCQTTGRTCHCPSSSTRRSCSG